MDDTGFKDTLLKHSRTGNSPFTDWNGYVPKLPPMFPFGQYGFITALSVQGKRTPAAHWPVITAYQT